MLVEVLGQRSPHRIQDEVNALTARQLRRRHKVGIASKEDDLIDLAFERKTCDVQSDPHVHALLPEFIKDVCLGEISNLDLALE